ncbi:MAG: hypothetical protein AB1505_33710 [Candidatus Latescibacterota bacterium]
MPPRTPPGHPDPPLGSWGAAGLALLLLLAGLASPAQARWHDEAGGRLFFSGEGNLFYGKARTVLTGAGAIGLKALLIAALLADDDEDDHGHVDADDCCACCDCSYDCYSEIWCDAPDVPVEGYQFGGSLGYFVAPGLAVGWRLLVHRNDHEDLTRAFWGGGPEVAVYGPAAANVRPFASLGALYTWDRTAGGRFRESRPARTSLLLRTGISVSGPQSALYLQTSYHVAARFDRHQEAVVSRPWGIGLGFTVFVH